MVEKKEPKKAPAKKPAQIATASKTRKPAKTASVPVRRRKPAAEEREPTAPAAAAPVRSAASPRGEVSGAPRPTGVQDLRPSAGATRSRKRVGRGPGSGHGKTAGRGSKGQKSRSGYRHLRGFEGGQMPLHRRVPKRGFTNIFRTEYDLVSLSDLEGFDAGDRVTPEKLVLRRLAHGRRPVKILGDGELNKPLTVTAHKFSASARSRIEAAGGRCEVIGASTSRPAEVPE
jgi:large subunit ribosomal protein L15